jgi:myosin heavy subunit
LGKEELYSSNDNKTGVYGLMDKIAFDREKYRLGHTKVFFKAGALAVLEENRDDIVMKMLRWFQGTAYGVLARKRYQIKSDQRDLTKIIQRNYRKYMMLRDWGWYVLVSKTKPMIGMRDVEGELGVLEEECNKVYGAYEDQVKTKERLLEENNVLKEEKKALVAQLQSEQGNIGEYTERQAMMNAMRADLEVELEERQNQLVQMEGERVAATEDKKVLEAENNIYKKDCDDLELAIQKLDQEKTNRDHTIRFLNDEIGNQDEIINKINKEKKHINETSSKASEDLQVET